MCRDRLTKILVQRVGDAAIVRVRSSIRLSGDAEPQPDLTLPRPREDFYARGHPTPEDVLLLIEVSDTTLGFDREVKLPLYARAGVPEVWIVDLMGEQVSAYSRPTEGVYLDTRISGRGASIDLLMLPGLTVSVDDVLG